MAEITIERQEKGADHWTLFALEGKTRRYLGMIAGSLDKAYEEARWNASRGSKPMVLVQSRRG
jgi:hypothetical protein